MLLEGSKGRERERRQILVAGEALISERGFARTTVRDVCERAGVTEDLFRAHFTGMGALLRALSADFVAQMKGLTDQTTGPGIWAGTAARDVVEVAVRSIVDVVLERQGLVRAFLGHGATDPALTADLRGIGTHLTERLVAVLGECTDVPVRPTRAIAFSLLVAASLAHQHVLVGDAWSGVSFSKEQLTEEAARMICAYLGLGPTIAFRDDGADAVPTGAVRAVRE